VLYSTRIGAQSNSVSVRGARSPDAASAHTQVCVGKPVRHQSGAVPQL
jgi:hypothetical protein